MEKKGDESLGEIEETSPLLNRNPDPDPRSVNPKPPEVEIHLFRQGKGPIEVFKANLGGFELDQLEVRDICDKYGLKSLFAFNSDSVRGVPIPYNYRNGRSLRSYKDGSVIYIDGEPKDPMIKPVTKIFIGVTAITILIALVMKEKPQWIESKLNSLGGSFPPWILACMVIVFTRLRKRTRDFLKRYGW